MIDDQYTRKSFSGKYLLEMALEQGKRVLYYDKYGCSLQYRVNGLTTVKYISKNKIYGKKLHLLIIDDV